jgi:methionyl-tRNA formyltransferase
MPSAASGDAGVPGLGERSGSPAGVASDQQRSLRVAFLGNDVWSVPSLGALVASRHPVALAVTARPKPARRGGELTPTPVARAARDLGVPLAEVETVKAGLGFERLAGSSPDVLVVVAYGEVLPRAVLELPAVAPVNLHFSLLPELRGASPVQTALLRGLDRTGVTTILMDEGLDTGPILVQHAEPIEPEDDAGSLGARLAEVGAAALVETLDALADGRGAPRPQDDGAATHAPKLGAGDRRLDWDEPAAALVARCRALSPDPGASTSFRGRVMKVFRAQIVDAQGEPGRIASVSKDGFVVATAAGGFRPIEIAPEGRRRMSGADFVHGVRPEVGERLG